MKKIEVFEGNSLGHEALDLCKMNPKCVMQGTNINGETIYVPFDEELLSRHLLFLGGIGTGKTNAIFQIIRQIKYNLTDNDVLFVFDTKGDFYREFYEKGDVVLSNDKVSTDYWNVFEELKNDSHQEDTIFEIARAFFEEKIKNTNQPFFPNAAKDLFAAIMIDIIRSNNPHHMNNEYLAQFLYLATGETLRNMLDRNKDFQGMKSYIFDDRSPQTMGVLAELQQFSRELFLGNFKKNGNLSIRNMVQEKNGKCVFVEYDLGIGNLLTPVYSLLFDLAIKEALSRNESEVRGNVYFVVDEFRLLPNLKHISDAVNFGRSLGIKFMIGIQNVEQIYEVYGEENARSIMSGFLSNVSFRVNDVHSKEYIQNLYGKNRKKEIYTSVIQGKGVSEQLSDGYVVEDWDISRLKTGEAIIGLPGAEPFLFQFKKY